MKKGIFIVSIIIKFLLGEKKFLTSKIMLKYSNKKYLLLIEANIKSYYK